MICISSFWKINLSIYLSSILAGDVNDKMVLCSAFVNFRWSNCWSEISDDLSLEKHLKAVQEQVNGDFLT